MAYRTIKFAWLPSTCQGWLIFTSVRKEAARLWSWLVERHATIRQLGGKWPSKDGHSEGNQGPVPGPALAVGPADRADFCEAVASAESLRKRGEPSEYPHRKTTYRQVLFTNQAPKLPRRSHGPALRQGRLSRSLHAQGRHPARPHDGGPARLRRGGDRLRGPHRAPDPRARRSASTSGVNTILAATDGDQAVLVSGREIKATVQLRNKRLAEIQQEARAAQEGVATASPAPATQAPDPGPRQEQGPRPVPQGDPQDRGRLPERQGVRRRAVQRRLPQDGSECVRRPCRRPATARSSGCCNYKLAACIEVEEHSSSKTCPVCGERSKHSRIYRCRRCRISKPPATSWGAPTSASSASRAACDRVVLYRTGSISCILPSILASAR